MVCLVVHEHERIPIATVRTDKERVLLQKEVDGLLRVCDRAGMTAFVVGHRSVKFAQFCGIIQTDAISVEILPKIASDDESFDRGVLLRMLAVALRLPVRQLGTSNLGLQSHTLLRILIQWFCTELNAQSRIGLMRQYVLQSDRLPVIRGRWRPDLDACSPTRLTGRLSCEYDEFTTDHRYNRALKAALVRVRALASGCDPLLRQIDLLLDCFHDVATTKVTAEDIAQLPKNRLTTRYSIALGMAAWFLEKNAPNLQHGQASGFAMLFDMNRLFQAFLGPMLRSALPSNYHLRQEGPRHFLTLNHENESRFQMRPDFCIVRGNTVKAIIDAKWKRLSADSRNGKWGVQQADIYQLHAYAHAYQCNTVALWYPQHMDIALLRERPVFRFLTRGTETTSASVALDWIPLGTVLGTQWERIVISALSDCLDRLEIRAGDS